MSLNLTTVEVENAHALHVPWGQPQPSDDSNLFTLTSQDYVTGLYSEIATDKSPSFYFVFSVRCGSGYTFVGILHFDATN